MNRRARQKRPSEASRAKNEAQANYDSVKRQWPEVNRVAASLREVRERNHFAERIESLIRGVN